MWVFIYLRFVVCLFIWLCSLFWWCLVSDCLILFIFVCGCCLRLRMVCFDGWFWCCLLLISGDAEFTWLLCVLLGCFGCDFRMGLGLVVVRIVWLLFLLCS